MHASHTTWYSSFYKKVKASNCRRAVLPGVNAPRFNNLHATLPQHNKRRFVSLPMIFSFSLKNCLPVCFVQKEKRVDINHHDHSVILVLLARKKRKKATQQHEKSEWVCVRACSWYSRLVSQIFFLFVTVPCSCGDPPLPPNFMYVYISRYIYAYLSICIKYTASPQHHYHIYKNITATVTLTAKYASSHLQMLVFHPFRKKKSES